MSLVPVGAAYIVKSQIVYKKEKVDCLQFTDSSGDDTALVEVDGGNGELAETDLKSVVIRQADQGNGLAAKGLAEEIALPVIGEEARVAHPAHLPCVVLPAGYPVGHRAGTGRVELGGRAHIQCLVGTLGIIESAVAVQFPLGMRQIAESHML